MNRRGLDRRWTGASKLGLAALVMGSMLSGQALRADEGATAAHAVRLSSVDGQVQILQDRQLLADPALVNTPLFEGTQVVTAGEGRAELQFEDGSVIRLSPDSSLTLTSLGGPSGSGDGEIVLEAGLGYFELQGEGTGSRIRVRFGDSVVTASGFTVLRVNLDNPPGEVAVFSGNAHLERGGGLALDLHGGESVALNPTDASRYKLSESIEPDSWDSWNADRDQALTAAAAERTGAASSLANSNSPAWNDLDAHGNWYNVPGQGYVWSPYEAGGAGWDPYGNGYWMWTPRFGYVWVSGDSWGYLPFQCGAWNYFNDFGWGWAPGMGMCQPWWGYGGGWGYNVGYAPPGYRYPKRPRTGPRGPIHAPFRGGREPVYPVVPVNRRPPGGTPGLPVRSRNLPVTIAGHVVQPLRPQPQPQPQRPHYDRPMPGYVNRPQPAPAYPGARAPVAPGRTTIYPMGGSHPGNIQGPRNSSPAPRAPAPSGGASSGHSSYGGGGGGASTHVSSGGGSSGGGGGGGGSHASSSGGGGGSHH